MRLDLFLKRSRLIPRRSVAQEICEAGAVSVNGQVSKCGKAIRVGDLISLSRKHKVTTIRVALIPPKAYRDEQAPYDLIEVKDVELQLAAQEMS